MSESCCEGMGVAVREGAVLLNLKFREWSVVVPDGGESSICLSYCPWCGAPLPSSMRDQWFDNMDALQIAPPYNDAPRKYLSDEWWRTPPGIGSQIE